MRAASVIISTLSDRGKPCDFLAASTAGCSASSNPLLTNDMIKPHFNRMASTRAMARVYRIYTNNANVSIEETGQEQESMPDEEELAKP